MFIANNKEMITIENETDISSMFKDKFGDKFDIITPPNKNICFENMIKTAKAALIKFNKFRPMFVFVKKDNPKCISITTSFENDNEKYNACAAFKKFVEVLDIDYYYAMFEGWMILRPGYVQPENVIPSQCLDRAEALMINKFSKDGKNKGCMLEFKRDNNKIEFVDEKIFIDENVGKSNFNFYE